MMNPLIQKFEGKNPKDGQVLRALLSQVSEAMHDKDEGAVITVISRPMYEAFARASLETSEHREHAADYRGLVFGTHTDVSEWPLYFSYSFQKKPRSVLTFTLGTLVRVIGWFFPRLSTIVGLKVSKYFTCHMHMSTVIEDALITYKPEH